MSAGSQIQPGGPSRRWLIWIVAAAAITFFLKTALALTTYGTNDILTWEQNLTKIESKGPARLYREGVQSFSDKGKPYYPQPFIHPPFMIHLLRFWSFVAEHSHRPMRFWIRLTAAVADFGSLMVLCQIGKRETAIGSRPVMLLLFAMCPISIMISGFHGNTDPIMIFLVLLSIYAIQAHKPPLLAGAFMGLALSIKIVPLIYVPVALFSLPDIGHKLRFLISLIVVWVISGLPYVLLHPILILSKLVSYTSLPQIWGWSLVPRLLDPESRYRKVYDNFDEYGKGVLLVGIVLISFGMNVSKDRLSLFAQCGLLTSLFIFCTPGFGVQYLSWLVPWVTFLAISAASAYYIFGSIFLFVVYTHWSSGVPWYLANSLEVPDWSRLGVCLGLSCWLISGILLLLFLAAWQKQNTMGRND